MNVLAAFILFYAFNDVAAKNVSENVRTPVKLTMKQGLIMNQVINTFVLTNVKNELCRNHSEEFKEGLRALEPWAIKMFDASSKLMPGVLQGNMAEPGSYEQCLNIHEETKYGPIKGRHCGFRITLTEELMKIVLKISRNISEKNYYRLKKTVLDDTKLVWSVCVPHSCTNVDVLPHYNKTIQEVAEGLNLSISLKKEHCVSKDDFPKITTGTYIFIFICGSIIAIVIICTLLDLCSSRENSSSVVGIFSVIKNGKMLLNTNHNNDHLGCLHGLRFLSVFYVVVGHRYVHLMANPTVNSIELVSWVETIFSTVVTGGTVSVDSFFLIGAVLLSYNFFNTVTKTNRFNIFYFYLYRHLRIDAPLIFAIVVHALALQHFGGGPFYYDFSYGSQKPCQVFWWTVILHIQAYVNKKFLCIIPSWYLTVDMFYYYLSPIILVPLWKQPVYGYVAIIILYILGVLVSFYTAWVWKFTGELPITRRVVLTDYFSEFYIQPHCRAPPYILGLAVGYALFKTKNNKVKMNKSLNIIGWLLTFVVMAAVVLSAHMFHVDQYSYNRWFSSLYAALHRSIWSLCLMWIIWCCAQDQAGFINDFLSHPVFKVLGRLGYTIFLLHFSYQGAMQASEKVPGYFSDFLAIYMSFGDMVLMIILCTGVTLCFEYPFVRIVGIILKRGSASTRVHPNHKNQKLERPR